MFNAPFSFEGRIRRTEYGLSVIIYSIVYGILNAIVLSSSRGSGGAEAIILLIFIIPLLWFFLAQGAKRCHDVGNSGWWQLIPLYGLWLLFQDGEPGTNQYGINPKNIKTNNTPPSQPNQTGGGYQGGYSGGHNNQGNISQQNPPNVTNTGEYRSGDLYN
jgi:uncharacterized membrane protein YhaH (DUF805 family)